MRHQPQRDQSCDIFQSRAGNDVLINITNNRGVGFVSGPVTVESNPPTFNTWEHYVVNFNATTGQGVVYRNGGRWPWDRLRIAR